MNSRGPAFTDRSLCVNESDFLTFDDIGDISYQQFFSYVEDNGKIYGFDILSLYTLYRKNKSCGNPYTRTPFPDDLIGNIQKAIRISRILKMPMDFDIDAVKSSNNNNETLVLSVGANAENTIISETTPHNHLLNSRGHIRLSPYNAGYRIIISGVDNDPPMDNTILEIFQEMDRLGNYTNTEWFTSLSARRLITFMAELKDIWTYRANITAQTQQMICPHHMFPFPNGINSITNNQLLAAYVLDQTEKLKSLVLKTMYKLVFSSSNDEYRKLGTLYVLGALTMVNENAANTMPWLYHSFSLY